jgi:hypothetical protein
MILKKIHWDNKQHESPALWQGFRAKRERKEGETAKAISVKPQLRQQPQHQKH